jgi:hypothetical protein
MPIADAFGPAPSTPATPALVVVKEWDLTDVTAADVSAAGAHAITTAGGAALVTITTGTEASAPTSISADLVAGASGGLVVDLQTTSDARDWVFYWPIPVTDIDLGIDAWMIEFLFEDVTLTATSNNSTMSWGMSTTTVMNGEPFQGMLLKNTASNMYWTVRRKDAGSASDAAATIDVGRISGEAIHMQIIGQNRGALVYKDSATAFSDTYMSSPTITGTTGSKAVNASAGAPGLWSSPYIICKNYLRYSGNRWQFKLKKVRVCKFTPYS